MPIYEYQCKICDHKLEVIQKFSDSPLTDCPECGKESLRKLISAASFKLKGTGWYETDFKDKPKNKDKSVDKAKTDSDETKKTAGTSDSKSSSTGASEKKTASNSD